MSISRAVVCGVQPQQFAHAARSEGWAGGQRTWSAKLARSKERSEFANRQFVGGRGSCRTNPLDQSLRFPLQRSALVSVLHKARQTPLNPDFCIGAKSIRYEKGNISEAEVRQISVKRDIKE